MLVVPLDRTSSTALHDQLADAIQERILRGLLEVGVRLPSTRSLAASCGVGRNTVLSAYDRLVNQGWLEARVGQGTFVAMGANRRRSTEPAPPVLPARFPWERFVATPELGGSGPSPEPAGETIDFAGAVPASEFYPLTGIRRAFRELWREEGGHALEYGPAAGYGPLREIVAERANATGAEVTADDVVIVGGLQRAVDLVSRLLISPGDRVVVEQPTYPHSIRVWRLNGAEIIGAAMDEGGVRVDEIRDLVRRTSPNLVSLMPTFHNPTGLTLDTERRAELMQVLGDAQVPVVENHFDSDLRYRGTAPPPLKAFDTRGQVLHLGTFSKMLFPGFRLGWVIVPRDLRDRLLSLKRTCDLTTNFPAQIAIAKFCLRGDLDRHLGAIRSAYAERLDAMLAAIDTHLPAVSATRPEGGMTLWLTLPAGTRSERLTAEAREAGVSIAPGTWFFVGDGRRGDRHARLSFVGEAPERIDSGIQILGDVLKRHLKRRRTRRAAPEDAPPFM